MLCCNCYSVLANYLPIDMGHLVGSDDHDMATAILLTKVTTDTVGDKIRIHDKQHGRLGELSFRHDPYTKVRPDTQ